MMPARPRSLTSSKLNEGMRAGDLNDLILPLISVDEYESKIDNDSAIVIGFYVHDKDAAADLNRFLQKSFVAMLDTDVSNAPDQHGYYLVFVELLNNERFAPSVKAILDDIKPLTDIAEWKMRIRKNDGLIQFSTEALIAGLKKAAAADKRAKRKDEVLDFLSSSNLNSVRVDEDDTITLDGGRSVQSYEILSFGTYEQLSEEFDISEAPGGAFLREAFQAQRLETLLGEGWNVSEIERKFLLTRYDTNLCLLVGFPS